MTTPPNTVTVTDLGFTIEITTADIKEPEIWESVPVSRLVELCASRKAPVDYENGNFDSSYMEADAISTRSVSTHNKTKPRGLFITDVSPYGHVSHSKGQLDPRWNDNGWVRAPDCWCSGIPNQKTKPKFPQKEIIITINSVQN
jgi:hypothetical protein